MNAKIRVKEHRKQILAELKDALIRDDAFCPDEVFEDKQDYALWDKARTQVLCTLRGAAT